MEIKKGRCWGSQGVRFCKERLGKVKKEESNPDRGLPSQQKGCETLGRKPSRTGVKR